MFLRYNNICQRKVCCVTTYDNHPIYQWTQFLYSLFKKSQIGIRKTAQAGVFNNCSHKGRVDSSWLTDLYCLSLS
jgi:hypothetical protein